MQENIAKTAAEWVFVAKSIAQTPGGESQALRCMARAGIAAQDVAGWIAVARAWAQDFGDSEMAQQCLGKAGSHAEDSEEWEQIADVWLEMGNYSKAVETYREWMSLRPWQYLEELKHIHGDNSDGTTVLDWAEPGMTARASRDSVGEAEGYIRDNQKESIRCLLEAESFADGSADWVLIAKFWKANFADSQSAIQCMEKAEEAVDTSYDWLQIAKVWNENFNDTDAAIACMEEAEGFSVGFHDKSADEWEAISDTWRDLGHESRADEAVLKAEQLFC